MYLCTTSVRPPGLFVHRIHHLPRMHLTVRNFIKACILLAFSPALHASCIDSVHCTIVPVQCFDMRDGEITIDSVFGGKLPYYFSIDGQSYSTRPFFDHLKAGPYTLWVRDESGCTIEVSMQVPEPEELQVHLTANALSVVVGIPVNLTAEILPEHADIATISWRPPAMIPSQDMLTQTVRLTENTVIAIEIIDKNGCVARDQVEIMVEKTNLYFPNIFKPGSNQNAYFTISTGEGVTRIALLQIYDRTGGLVFERANFLPNDPLRGWNGRASNGKLVQPGAFLWFAVLEYADGSKSQHSGSVTVIR